jgi:hypothetical protein
MSLGVRIAALLLALGVMFPAWPGDSESLSAATRTEIEYLLDRVSGSGYTFVRNGDSHAGPKAASHMRRKYEHFLKKGEIGDTEDFIDLAGTKSLLSGSPYTVRLDDGQEIMTADWLRRELQAFRAKTVARQQ